LSRKKEEGKRKKEVLPPDLQAVRDDMDAADRAAEELAARLKDDEFFWQPDGGRRWSVALCLDHLAVANTVYGASIRGAIETAKARGWGRRGPGAPGFFGRQFIASLEPPVKRRSGAPGKIKPMPNRGRDEILRAYRTAHDDIRTLIDEAAATDVNRATFRNPFIPIVRVKVATAFQVIAAHDRRHLWQAEQVEREIRQRAAP
jgi:hypothetical protein